MTVNKSKKIDLRPKVEKSELSPERKNRLLIIAVGVSALVIFSIWILVLRISWQSQGASFFNFGKDIKDILDEPVPELESSLNFELPPLPEVPVDEKNELELGTTDLLQSIINDAETKSLKSQERACPEWINCMPTIGEESSPCLVPPGCEDITQIAY